MFVIDTNSLIVLLLGTIDTKYLGTHKRVSLYNEDDFEALLEFVKSFENLLVPPNVWTEVDNLLNGFSGSEKYPYIQIIISAIRESSEQYLRSSEVLDAPYFFNMGLTDSLLLTLGMDNDCLITSDSILSDYANALDIQVYDMVKIKNERLLSY